MNVHITLVGGQPAPVYHGIVYANPDKVVYFYSAETHEIAEQISNEVKIPSERRRIDPVNLNDIEKKVLLCKENFAKDTITINISGGTKPWAYYFVRIFGEVPNVEIFYVDQNNVVWNFSNKSKVSVHFDMDAQFRLHGNPLEEYLSFAEIQDDDKQVVADINSMIQFSQSAFFRLVKAFKGASNLTFQQLEDGSFLEWNTKEKSFEMSIVKRGQYYSKKLKSKNVRHLLLKTGWFEYEVALLISHWDKAKDIRLNCIFPYKDTAPKNEIDVLVDTGTKLLFVECKTQIEDNTDIDKFRAAVNNYGGLGSKALFVTKVKMKDKTKEKCEDNGILTFSMSDDHLGLSKEQALILLLESELFNINAK